jgi:hypothetical protein
VPVERPPSATDTPPPSGNTGEQPAQADSHFILRLEEGEFDANTAEVHVNLAVEPADADLTRTGVRTALLELHHSSNLVLQDPSDLGIVAGAAAPGIGIRTRVEGPTADNKRVLRTILVNWNDTLIKPGRVVTINFRRAGPGPYNLSWKKGPDATVVTPPSANETLELEDAVFNFEVR